jgi:pimeloyl-ACP methyl ester carboxylesterase
MSEMTTEAAAAVLMEQARWWLKPRQVKRGFVDGRFGQVHYRMVRPSKPTAIPLVMFHQSPASGRAYQELLVQMGIDRVTVAPDTPGFGDSAPPPAPPTIADYAAAMGDFLDAMGLGTVDVLGDHTGAKIAVELAQQRPTQIRRLIFNACPVYTPEQVKEQQHHVAEEKPQPWPADGSHLLQRWARTRSYYPEDAPLDLFDRDFTEMLRAGPLAWYGHHAAFAYYHADNLPLLDQPVLVMCPDDGLWDETQRSKQYLKNGRVLDLPDWRMGAISQHAPEMAKIFRDFLDTPDPAVRPPAPAAKSVPVRPAMMTHGVRRRFVSVAGSQIHVREVVPAKATQTPILCLHMSPLSGRGFEPLLRELGQTRIAWAADLPGFGESDPPVAQADIAELAAMFAQVIEKLAPGQAIDVLGDHTGAVIAMHLAAMRPDLVRKLSLNTVPWFTREERAPRLAHTQPSFPRPDGAHLVDLWARIQKMDGPGVTPEMIERNFIEASRGKPYAWWGHHAVFSYDEMEDTMARIRQPLLVFRPKDGLEGNTERAMPHLKTARLHDVMQYKYGYMEANMREIADVLRGFLDQ